MCRIESFEAFDQVFLMTYLFEGTPCKAYFDLNGWGYKYWYVQGTSYEQFNLSETPVQYTYPDLKSLITIKHRFNGSSLDTSKGSFSKSWYDKNSAPEAETEDWLLLKRHLASFFRLNDCGGHENNMWTTFKDYIEVTEGARYAKGFIPCNSKATNDFRHKRVLAYPINRYLNPNLLQFIKQRGGKVKNNDFALTEMVQWIWRSAIRDGQPIVIYIPSDRMYKIFIKWLNQVAS